MKIGSIDIIGQLERLAAAFPWDTTEIDIKRTPEGEFRFVVYVPPHPTFGGVSIFETGASPSEAVDAALVRASSRDPEIARQQTLRELREKVAKLEAAAFTIPPYRPGTILTNGEATINVPETVEV